MAYILHIDTSANNGITALSHDGLVVSAITNPDARNHAATINLHIEKVLTDAGIRLHQLDAVSVCGGPGSYTGLRIGLATAKGLCYTLDKPLLMHNKLLLLLLPYYYQHGHIYNQYDAILIAREKEYYYASYTNTLQPLAPPQHITESQLAELTAVHTGKTMLTGEITDAITDYFTPDNTTIIHNNNIDITSWATYASEQYKQQHFADVAHSEPFYLKQVYTHK